MSGTTPPMVRWAYVIAALVALLSLPGCDDGSRGPTPTYYAQVKPIVDGRCLACHVDGGIAPFPLVTYEDVRGAAPDLARVVEERIMPPWLASPGCTTYDHDLSLSATQIETLTRWAREGTPAGDASLDLPPDTVELPQLARRDLVLSMDEAYTPTRTPDDYRCFLLDWPETSRTYVTGISLEPGNRRIVHHIIPYLAGPASAAEYEALDAADPGPGYTCFGGPGLNNLDAANWLGAWAPGMTAIVAPEGSGVPIEPGSKLILQVHYNTRNGVSESDLTRVALSLAERVDRPGRFVPWLNPLWIGTDAMRIPAGATDAVHRFSFAFPVTVDVYKVGLHMHQLGTAGRLQVVAADGSSTACLLDVERWDFEWQRFYDLAAPLRLKAGDRLEVECHWANPTDRDVFWGDGTEDEMCIGILYVAAPAD